MSGVIAAFVLPAVLGAADLVRNGGFESGTPPGADGWDVRAPYAVAENAGRNGTRGMHWKNELAGSSPFCGQPVKLLPGCTYEFSCWVKARGLRGRSPDGIQANATVLMTLNDEKGNYLQEFAAGGVTEDCDDWKRISGRTSRIPENVGSCTIMPFVWHGATGEAWFDDISLVPLEERPIAGLRSSVYRDTAWEGDVTFQAVLSLNAVTSPPDALEAVFTLPPADFGAFTADTPAAQLRVRRPAAVFTMRRAALTVPVASLPKGRSLVSFELRERATGSIRASADLVFTRLTSAPDWKVRIDRRNRLIVDGRPFFPLGFYVAGYVTGPDAGAVGAFSGGPFNCVLPYNFLGREVYDRFAAEGLKIIASVKDFYPDEKVCRGKLETAADGDRAALAFVSALRDRPEIIAWYVNDEKALSQRDLLQRRYDLLREADPDRPTYAALYQHDQIADYMGTSDILGTDPYPVPEHPLSRAADFTRRTVAGNLGGPVWQVPQAFSWKWYGNSNPKCRVPNLDEIRAMTWQCIANGANGIIYWAQYPLMRNLGPEEFAAVWKDYCEVGREVARFFPVLLADEDGPAVTGYAPGTSGRSWRKDGAGYLLVVNETPEKVRTELSVDGPFTGPTALTGGGACRVERLDGNRLSLVLEPLACVMLSLGR